MKIAQIAPLFEAVPPTLYGGTERIVSYLSEELVRQGHEVTLYASADSQTQARLVPACARGLRLAGVRDGASYHVALVEQVFQQAQEFDVLHFHIEPYQYPLARRQTVAALTTTHGRLDLSEAIHTYATFSDAAVVSISDAQRQPLPWLPWLGTVHHGLPPSLYQPGAGAGRYLLFLGRISPEKGPDRAIEIARRAGVPLRMAAKVDPADQDYFQQVIRPLLAGGGVEFLGEVGDRDKERLLGDALALLFPIDWPEPFGLVLIEAMACGTPVVAFRRGSVPEVIEDGRTGFVVDGVEEACAAVERAAALDRSRCRGRFEQRFTAARMARDYLALYRRLVATRQRLSRATAAQDAKLETMQ